MTQRLRRRTLLILTAALALASPALAAFPAAEPDDMTMGSAKAPVTLIEYASASCPHCARFNNNVFPEFRRKYIDTGKVHYVFREFLTQPVEVAMAGFLLARCAGKDKYFSVLDDYFRGQEEMYRTGKAGALINAVGARAGLTAQQINSCLGDEASAQALNNRVTRYANEDGVDSTPTFLINGKKLAGLDHEVNLADLDGAIGPLLGGPRRR